MVNLDLSDRPVPGCQIPDLDYSLVLFPSAIFCAKHDCAFKQRNCATSVSQCCEEAPSVPTKSAEDYLRYRLELAKTDDMVGMVESYFTRRALSTFSTCATM
jgi:hypothetical protein